MTAIATPTTSWTIDPTHSTIGFAVKHMVFSTVRGTFSDVAGSFSVTNDDLRTATLSAEIGVASINTGTEQRDAHLKSADFFDAEHFPKATFVSAGMTPAGDGSWLMAGTLTIRGTSKPVTLVVTPEGTGSDPWGNTKSGYSATTKIDRRDFGLNYNQVLETGGVLVGNDISLTLDIQAKADA